MPLITVEMWEGRPVDVKRKLVKDITKVCVDDLGCPDSAVTIILKDVPKHNWGSAGELASDSQKK